MVEVMRNITLPIIIEADADGFFVSCPALQGCYSQGDTYEEAIKNIKDAIKLHLVDGLADGEEIPQVSVSLSTVDIAVGCQAPRLDRARNLFRIGKTAFFQSRARAAVT